LLKQQQFTTSNFIEPDVGYKPCFNCSLTIKHYSESILGTPMESDLSSHSKWYLMEPPQFPSKSWPFSSKLPGKVLAITKENGN